MPVENADAETVSVSTNPKFLALIERSRRRRDAEGGNSSAEVRRRLQAKPKRAVTSERARRQSR